MTLTELRYVVAVARERHFGRAAETCFVSQPTLSVAIKKLEEELGVTLFERSAGDVAITPIGSEIVEQARRVLEEADALKVIAAQGKDQLAGPLRFGVIFTIGPYLLPHLIMRLRDVAPHMPLMIEENYTENLVEKLRRAELDVIVLSLPFSEAGLTTQPLYDEEFFVAIPKGHPWESRKAVPPDDLLHEHLLLLGAGNCFRDQVMHICPEPGGSHVQRTLEGSSLTTLRHMVASGVGVTVVPGSSVEGTLSEERLISVRPFTSPPPTRRVVLCWRRRFARPQAVEALRAAILECELHAVTMLDLPPLPG